MIQLFGLVLGLAGEVDAQAAEGVLVHVGEDDRGVGVGHAVEPRVQARAIERGERSLTLDTLVRLVNRLGVTVDYLLADSVTGSDEAVLDEFKQIVDNQPLERKLMALQVLRTIFAYFEKEGA